MENYDYKYDVPFNLGSKKEILVLNNEDKPVYILKRFHQSVIDVLLAFRDPKSSVNIVLTDKENNKLVQSIEAWSFRRKFHVTNLGPPKKLFIVTQENNGKFLNKELHFEMDDVLYTVRIDPTDNRKILWRDTEKIMEMIKTGKFGSKKNYIKVINEEFPIENGLCLLHTFEIGIGDREGYI